MHVGLAGIFALIGFSVESQGYQIESQITFLAAILLLSLTFVLGLLTNSGGWVALLLVLASTCGELIALLPKADEIPLFVAIILLQVTCFVLLNRRCREAYGLLPSQAVTPTRTARVVLPEGDAESQGHQEFRFIRRRLVLVGVLLAIGGFAAALCVYELVSPGRASFADPALEAAVRETLQIDRPRRQTNSSA